MASCLTPSGPTAALALPTGAALIVVTDGVTERSGPAGDFGMHGVLAATEHGADGESPAVIVDGIVERCQAHAAGAPSHDNLTVVALRPGEGVREGAVGAEASLA